MSGKKAEKPRKKLKVKVDTKDQPIDDKDLAQVTGGAVNPVYRNQTGPDATIDNPRNRNQSGT